MERSRHRIRISTPMDKNGVPIKLSITADGDHTLFIQHLPDHSLTLYGFFVSLLLTIGFSFVGVSLAVFPAIALIVSGFALASRRDLTFTANRLNGICTQSIGGVLGSGFGEQQKNCKISQIARVEIHQYANSWSDTFQLRLMLDSGERLDLSASNLGLSECQGFAEEIRSFLELQSPVKAVG